MNMSAAYFRKQIFLPQDHGSWVFIFSPLLVGLFAGKYFGAASVFLVIAAVAERGENVFPALLEAAEVCSLGQITGRLQEVVGHFRPMV